MISGHLIQASAPAYARRDDSAGELFTPREFTSGREVGIVELVGPLGKRELVHARERVNKLAADDLVGEILVVVDSPGGTVAGTHDLYAAIDRATKIKRVTAVVEDLAASAAYWAIAGASEIVLNPTGEVGSIGVFVVLADASRMFEKLGVDVLVIRSGRHKGTGTLGTKVTAEDIEQLQAVVDEHGRHFLAAVAHGRRMTAERGNDFADGRILVGNQAKAAGLVDRIAKQQQVGLRDRYATSPQRRTCAVKHPVLHPIGAEGQPHAVAADRLDSHAVYFLLRLPG